MTIKNTLTKIISLALFAALAAVTTANITVKNYARYTTTDISQLPAAHACLVLGTSKQLPSGAPSAFFEHRMAAAAAVYFAGKCQKILVSGDSVNRYYRETEDMQSSLIARGVRPADIVSDGAGVRTLDSVLRFKAVFGQTSGIVLSQQFHNERAIYIASHHAIALRGFNAEDVDWVTGFKTSLREVVAKCRAVLDVALLDTQPKYPATPVAI